MGYRLGRRLLPRSVCSSHPSSICLYWLILIEDPFKYWFQNQCYQSLNHRLHCLINALSRRQNSLLLEHSELDCYSNHLHHPRRGLRSQLSGCCTKTIVFCFPYSLGIWGQSGFYTQVHLSFGVDLEGPDYLVTISASCFHHLRLSMSS